MILPAWVLCQRRVQTNLLQWNCIEIVALGVVQVLCEGSDGATIVWVVLACAFIYPIQQWILLRIVAWLTEILVVVTLIGGVSGVQYVTAQLLTTEIDVGDAPTLQVVHTETFTEEFASTLTTNLIEHVHLVANGLVGLVIPPSCIPYVLDERIGEVGNTGTVTKLVDGDVEVGIRNLTIAQLASCLGIVEIYLGKAEKRQVWRLCSVRAIALRIIFTTPIIIEVRVVAEFWSEDASYTSVCWVRRIELVIVLHE